jgi:hypothetical protein
MKLTNKQLKQIIKEELNQVLKEANLMSIFSSADGSVDKDLLSQYFITAEQGDKESAEALWHAAPMLVKKGHKFSFADGTPMKRDAIAKAYGLDMPSSSSEPNSTSSNNEPAVDNKKATKNADMVKMIQLKIDRLDPDEDAERINKLKKKMEVFK